MAKKPKFDETFVGDLSEMVYRDLLEAENYEGAVGRMLAEDGDGGVKLRNRSRAYDRLTRAYLRAISAKMGITFPANAEAERDGQ